jgi:hypothetical protein
MSKSSHKTLHVTGIFSSELIVLYYLFYLFIYEVGGGV